MPRQHLTISQKVKIGGEGGIRSQLSSASVLEVATPPHGLSRHNAHQTSFRLSHPHARQEISVLSPHFTSFRSEKGGFEPPRGYEPLTLFESAAFNHSATSPRQIPPNLNKKTSKKQLAEASCFN